MEVGLSKGAHSADGAALLSKLIGTRAAKAATDFTADELVDQIPKDWVGSEASVDYVVGSASLAIIEASKNHLSMLYGTSVSMVTTAFLKGLFRARLSQDPSSILTDMLISVFVSQTVSREWAPLYAKIGSDSIFKQFEISSGRTPDAKVPASNWVATSKMNATALNILGQLIMASASATSSLGMKARKDGTIFATTMIPVEQQSEYHRITAERAKTITDVDKACLKVFSTHAATLVLAVEKILTGGSDDVEEVAGLLKKLTVKNF